MADDVVYLVDGIERLRALYAGGPSQLLIGLLTSSPHSLFSSLLAMICFALFGIHDCPLSGNAVIVFGSFAVTDRLMAGANLYQRVLSYVFVRATQASPTDVEPAEQVRRLREVSPM